MAATQGGGGAATQAGTDYQNRVAAWMVTRILAEREASPPWDLPSTATLDFLRCETEQPVDDIQVGTSENGYAFLQVKHTVNLEKAEDSALASCLDQFVRQFVAYRGMQSGRLPWERTLDPIRDRLVLVASSRSSTVLRERLPTIVARSRALIPGQPLESVAITQEEQATLQVVQAHLSRSWLAVMGAGLTKEEIRTLFQCLYVQILDVDIGGDHEREAKDVLRTTILSNPSQADLAWGTLIQTCAGFASARSGADRPRLQQHLLNAGIALKAPQSYRSDIRV